MATSATALNLNPDITRVCAEQNTSAVVSGLPLNGTDVYMRVWALVNGQWQYEDHQLGTSGLDDARDHVTRTYLVADHLQTPRFGYNTNGQLVWRWASDAFGNEASNADVDADGKPVAMNLRFPGQYYDSESGLHYNWNRYYDPETGRYVTSDPIGLAGGLNTFGYVGGNPIKYFDFYGLDSSDVFDQYGPVDGYIINAQAGSFLRARAEDAAKNYLESNNIPKGAWNGSANGGVADAIRHCVWSCEMARGLGPSVSRFVGNMHEDDNGPLASDMDRANNEIGCFLAENGDENASCEVLCNANKPDLMIEDRGGKMVPAGNRRF